MRAVSLIGGRRVSLVKITRVPLGVAGFYLHDRNSRRNLSIDIIHTVREWHSVHVGMTNRSGETTTLSFSVDDYQNIFALH